MKKIVTILSIFLVSFSYAQSLEKGKIQLNSGFGTSTWASPVYFGADYGLSKTITIGAEASYQSYRIYRIKNSIIGFQGNANYHFNEILKVAKEWDFYAGINLNYYCWIVEDKKNNDLLVVDERFGVGTQIGARYFFNKNFAINIEGGTGSVTSLGKIGITYKL